MPRQTNVLTVSIPQPMTDALEEFSKQTAQTRSELVRNALRSYFSELLDERAQFMEAFKATRREGRVSLDKLKKKYGLE